jgi:hypothetical protein
VWELGKGVTGQGEVLTFSIIVKGFSIYPKKTEASKIFLKIMGKIVKLQNKVKIAIRLHKVKTPIS